MFKYFDEDSVLITPFFRIKSSTAYMLSTVWHFEGLFSNRTKLFQQIDGNMLINLDFIRMTFYKIKIFEPSFI